MTVDARTPIRLGTRRSALARTQSEWVADLLRRSSGLAVELVEVVTEGDVNQAPLSSLGGTGVFVSALRELFDLDPRTVEAVTGASETAATTEATTASPADGSAEVAWGTTRPGADDVAGAGAAAGTGSGSPDEHGQAFHGLDDNRGGEVAGA